MQKAFSLHNTAEDYFENCGLLAPQQIWTQDSQIIQDPKNA